MGGGGSLAYLHTSVAALVSGKLVGSEEEVFTFAAEKKRKSRSKIFCSTISRERDSRTLLSFSNPLMNILSLREREKEKLAVFLVFVSFGEKFKSGWTLIKLELSPASFSGNETVSSKAAATALPRLSFTSAGKKYCIDLIDRTWVFLNQMHPSKKVVFYETFEKVGEFFFGFELSQNCVSYQLSCKPVKVFRSLEESSIIFQ